MATFKLSQFKHIKVDSPEWNALKEDLKAGMVHPIAPSTLADFTRDMEQAALDDVRKIGGVDMGEGDTTIIISGGEKILYETTYYTQEGDIKVDHLHKPKEEVIPPVPTTISWKTVMGDITIADDDVIDGDFTVVETDPTKLIE